MKDFKDEKLKAISTQDVNPKYNVERNKLEQSNDAMKQIGKSNIKQVAGIKTRKRTNKEYKAIWEAFLKEEPAFKEYMGYGLHEIMNIGYKKFIDFMDWYDAEDIQRYKSDRVKALPCRDCGLHMTTYQLDFGLCDNCKPKYDLEHFGEACAMSDEMDPGSSNGLIAMFAFLNDFRRLYLKNRKLEECIDDCILLDELKGVYTMKFLKERIVGNPVNEGYFVGRCSRLQSQSKLTPSASKYFQSIAQILTSETLVEKKIERLDALFRV